MNKYEIDKSKVVFVGFKFSKSKKSYNFKSNTLFELKRSFVTNSVISFDKWVDVVAIEKVNQGLKIDENSKEYYLSLKAETKNTGYSFVVPSEICLFIK